MDTVIDLCFLCTRDFNCVLADKKIMSQVEYLLPEITIIKLGIPLRICSDCDGALCAFSKFKLTSVESSRRLEARIQGAQGPPVHTGIPPVVDDNEKPEKIEEIFIKEEYVEETPLDTNRAFLNPIALVETIIAEPYNQLPKDRLSQNIQLHTDTNADNTEEILIKEETTEDTWEDKIFYNDILKEEYDVRNSMNDYTDRLPVHNTDDENATLNISEEVWEGSSFDSVEEIVKETDENCRINKIIHKPNNQEKLNKKIECSVKYKYKYNCNVCKKIFINESFLNKHMNLHREIRNFSCSICKKRFINNHYLKQHIELHSDQTKSNTNASIQIKNSLLCSFCNKKFKNKILMDWHIKLHCGLKNLHCKICLKSFTQEDDLTVHMRSHSGVKDLQCNIGSKEILHKQILVSKMRNNSKIMNFQCEMCDKTFNHKENLNEHMKTHSEIKDFQCEMCGKSFKRKNDLTSHKKSHSGVRDFRCEICDKSFKHRESLSKHMKIHSGIKDFQCEICKKSFMIKCQLTSHMKIHSDIKDFHCEICKKSFTHKYSLKYHMEHHCGMDEFL